MPDMTVQHSELAYLFGHAMLHYTPLPASDVLLGYSGAGSHGTMQEVFCSRIKHPCQLH